MHSTSTIRLQHIPNGNTISISNNQNGKPKKRHGTTTRNIHTKTDNMKEEKNEDKQVAVNYIYNFYIQLNQLNHWYALYNNYISDINTKYDTETIKKMQKGELTNLKTTLDNIRYTVNQTYILYKTIFIYGLNITEDKIIQEKRRQINESIIIKNNDVEEYVLALNKLLMDKVIKNFLEGNSEIIEDLYGTK